MNENETTGSAVPLRSHLDNVADNLQLMADLAYGNVALLVADQKGRLIVESDVRPHTAVAPVSASRVGQRLSEADEPEAYDAFRTGRHVSGERTRSVRGIKYTTAAYPIGYPKPYAVVVRDLADQVAEAPGAMEIAFMEAARDMLDALRTGPLLDSRSGEPFFTHRSAGDGVLRISADGRVAYSSPNAVNILREAGAEPPIVGTSAPELPGGGYGIAPVVGTRTGINIEVDVGGRTLLYRGIGVPSGALVLIEDVTEARRRDVELRVKDATIREIHHRVKNNLQTIASLLRIQARRLDNDEARHALEEATERVGAMAVVHDLLSTREVERVDFMEVTRTIVGLVTRGLIGEGSNVSVSVEGSTGDVDAHIATSLSLVVAELVHNALEHGVESASDGEVVVRARRLPAEMVVSVRDNGIGLPSDFRPDDSANLGLAIVRSVVRDDLRGTLTFTGGRGTTVTVRIPIAEESTESGRTT